MDQFTLIHFLIIRPLPPQLAQLQPLQLSFSSSSFSSTICESFKGHRLPIHPDNSLSLIVRIILLWIRTAIGIIVYVCNILMPISLLHLMLICPTYHPVHSVQLHLPYLQDEVYFLVSFPFPLILNP